MNSKIMTQKFQVDMDLILKYNQPGPRYTSYPTAPNFSSDIGWPQFEKSLQDGHTSNRDLSLYFHLPFCAKLCYFCGCTMLVTRNRDRIKDYVDYIIKEMSILSAAAGKRRVSQIHWGGGTPTYLSPDETSKLIDAIHANYDVAPDAEISIEVDPREVTPEHYKRLRAGGFNRLSIGVQDFYEPTQKAINRIQPEALTIQNVEQSREAGFESVNLDLIYGLPHQTVKTFADTLGKIIAIRPDRIALFSYAHVPWMKKHQNIIKDEWMPKPEEKLRILKYAIECLTESGYAFIGMDHFALPEDSLTIASKNKTLYRNFQGYSTHADCDLLGHGMSSISQTADVYAQSTKSFDGYYAAVDGQTCPIERGYKLDSEDQLRREVIVRLMCDFSLNFRAIEKRFNIDFKSCFDEELARLDGFVLDGLLTLDSDGIEIKGMGKLLIRNIAMTFDKFLQQKSSTRFSKTI